jgi:hypothetical protein
MRVIGLILAPLAVLIGCQPRATFDVSVVNETRSPLTVGLVKDGPPAEKDFEDVSQLAIDYDLASLPPWGFVIPSGKTADRGPVTGTFPSGTLAYLRVYRGELRNAELIATSAPNPGRLDLLLHPGRVQFTIREDEATGKLVAREQRLREAAR